MNVYRAPGIIGIVLAAGLCWLALAGYSVFIYYSWPIILFVLLVIAALTIVRQRSIAAYIRALFILVMLSTAAAFAGHWGRRLHCRNKCKLFQPILKSIEDYRAEHSRYPEKLAELPGFDGAQQDAGLVIGQGELSKYGINLNGINSHDALIYLGTDFILCVVPVTKQLPMSITRLYVYQWDSDTRSWKYDKLIWYLGWKQTFDTNVNAALGDRTWRWVGRAHDDPTQRGLPRPNGTQRAHGCGLGRGRRGGSSSPRPNSIYTAAFEFAQNRR